MKKALSILVALGMTTVLLFMPGTPPAKAEASCEGLTIAAPYEGSIKRLADDPQVSFSLVYQLPQFVGQDEVSDTISRFFAALPEQFDTLFDSQVSQVFYDVSHLSDRYVSVRLTGVSEGMHGYSETVHAFTFALEGLYSGQQIILSQLLGIEQQNADQQNGIEEAVKNLIWQIIEMDMQRIENDYLDGIARDDLNQLLTPELNFYLDAEGNIVFYIQSGEIASEMAGILYYPFSADELLSALNEKNRP